MSDDIYNELLKDGFIRREKDIELNKQIMSKNRRRNKILNKIMFQDISSSDSDSEDYTLTERETKMNYIDSLIEENNFNEIVKSIKKKYEIELHQYEYIDGNNTSYLKLGGYIRYVTFEEELKWGGILVKIENCNEISKLKLYLKNTSNKVWKINFNRFFVFYKNHKTRNDKLRGLFTTTAHLEF